MISIHIPGTPTAKARPRFSRKLGRAFTPAKTRVAEETLAARALVALRAVGVVEPLRGPLSLSALFALPVPPSWPAWQRTAALAGAFHPVASRTDVDNYAKALLDALNGILYVDDVQVVSLRAEKQYRAVPGIALSVAVLAQAEKPARHPPHVRGDTVA